MRYCAKILNTALLGLSITLLAACGEQAIDYGFDINNVAVNRGYQSLDIHVKQDLDLSPQAMDALQHGVTLTIRLDMELRNDNNMIIVRRQSRRFQIRYLPLSERYQLIDEEREKLQTFVRLRHLFAAISDLQSRLQTGPLPSGNYELRTRVKLDEGLLPAPMQLPALFSSQWRHDSEWSVWPFKISV
jgi:outer membrane lipopolysaccharide assembly protein LptE/RlpB